MMGINRKAEAISISIVVWVLTKDDYLDFVEWCEL